MGRILGLDIGKKRVGLAISDELMMIASPLTFIHFEDLERKIKELITENDIDTIVIGLPRNMDGSEGTLAGFIRVVAGKIEKMVDGTANEGSVGETHDSVILATARRPESKRLSEKYDSGQARMTEGKYLSVILVDETLSSVEALSRLRKRKKNIKEKGEIDMEAAAIILENYLKEKNVE